MFTFVKGERMNKITFLFLLACLLVSAQYLTAQEKHMMHKMPMIDRAVALITPTQGNFVHGTVTFQKTDKGVHIVATLMGLKPGKHGFHIHEFGDITSADGSSAGGHFNPEGMPHSMPMSNKRHAGDMGNILADENGNAHLDYVDNVMKLDGPHSIIGHAVIIHEKEDDFTTQPTGNAGARVGNGVIGIAK
jgi:superoxide dismutase, Cu-Zn family